MDVNNCLFLKFLYCHSLVLPDLPAVVLFAVGGACILAVSILLALLTHFAWSHYKTRETKPNPVLNDQHSRSPNDLDNGTWMCPSSEPEDQAEKTGLLEQNTSCGNEMDQVLPNGERICCALTTDKRMYHHINPERTGIRFNTLQYSQPNTRRLTSHV